MRVLHSGYRCDGELCVQSSLQTRPLRVSDKVRNWTKLVSVLQSSSSTSDMEISDKVVV